MKEHWADKLVRVHERKFLLAAIIAVPVYLISFVLTLSALFTTGHEALMWVLVISHSAILLGLAILSERKPRRPRPDTD